MEIQQWFDYKLVWSVQCQPKTTVNLSFGRDPVKFNGIKKLHIPSDLIWTPDIIVGILAQPFPSNQFPFLAVQQRRWRTAHFHCFGCHHLLHGPGRVEATEHLQVFLQCMVVKLKLFPYEI